MHRYPRHIRTFFFGFTDGFRCNIILAACQAVSALKMRFHRPCQQRSQRRGAYRGGQPTLRSRTHRRHSLLNDPGYRLPFPAAFPPRRSIARCAQWRRSGGRASRAVTAVEPDPAKRGRARCRRVGACEDELLARQLLWLLRRWGGVFRHRPEVHERCHPRSLTGTCCGISCRACPPSPRVKWDRGAHAPAHLHGVDVERIVIRARGKPDVLHAVFPVMLCPTALFPLPCDAVLQPEILLERQADDRARAPVTADVDPKHSA